MAWQFAVSFLRVFQGVYCSHGSHPGVDESFACLARCSHLVEVGWEGQSASEGDTALNLHHRCGACEDPGRKVEDERLVLALQEWEEV